MEYKVCWEIDIEADSPDEAAAKARKLQLDSLAQVGAFDVRDGQGQWYHVDLTPDDDDVMQGYKREKRR